MSIHCLTAGAIIFGITTCFFFSMLRIGLNIVPTAPDPHTNPWGSPRLPVPGAVPSGSGSHLGQFPRVGSTPGAVQLQNSPFSERVLPCFDVSESFKTRFKIDLLE